MTEARHIKYRTDKTGCVVPKMSITHTKAETGRAYQKQQQPISTFVSGIVSEGNPEYQLVTQLTERPDI